MKRSERVVMMGIAMAAVIALGMLFYAVNDVYTEPEHATSEAVTLTLTVHGEPVDTVRVWLYRGVQIVEPVRKKTKE